MVRNAREENARRGGWVRIFPTGDTWMAYGSMLEFSSPNNQILHEHLFPDSARKHAVRNGASNGNAVGGGANGSGDNKKKKQPTAYYRECKDFFLVFGGSSPSGCCWWNGMIKCAIERYDPI